MTKRLAIIASNGGLFDAYKVFNIATAAAATDIEVGIFFTFEGLNLIHKQAYGNLEMPKGKEHFAEGFKNANVPTIPELADMAVDMGIKIIACQMTMDVMSLKKEDFIDGIDVGGDGKAIIVDTSRMIEQYENFLNEHHLKLLGCIDTHLHADHISGARELTEKLGGTYYLPEKDADEVTFSYQKLEDGAEITVGNITVKALYSPGHTIGSTSVIVDNKYLLTGDILFIDSIGRPDLAGKAEDWVNDLRETLYERYKQVADELIVLPAHFMGIKEMNQDGSVSRKLGTLYNENHGLNISDKEIFRKTVTENLPPQPNAYQEIRQTNMGKINPDEEKQREMEIGPNRCAVRE